MLTLQNLSQYIPSIPPPPLLSPQYQTQKQSGILKSPDMMSLWFWFLWYVHNLAELCALEIEEAVAESREELTFSPSLQTSIPTYQPTVAYSEVSQIAYIESYSLVRYLDLEWGCRALFVCDWLLPSLLPLLQIARDNCHCCCQAESKIETAWWGIKYCLWLNQLKVWNVSNEKHYIQDDTRWCQNCLCRLRRMKIVCMHI